MLRKMVSLLPVESLVAISSKDEVIVNTEKCGFSGMEHAIGRLE